MQVYRLECRVLAAAEPGRWSSSMLSMTAHFHGSRNLPAS